MKQNIEELIVQAFDSIKQSNVIPQDISISVKVDRNKNPKQGDFSTNVAMIFAKACGHSPQQLATLIVEALPVHAMIERAEVAGPGFINFFVRQEIFFKVIQDILEQKESFGCNQIGNGQRVILEYVSANPTGPLHVGHGRSAAFGASLSNLLSASGFNVVREYYINDAGRQMDILAVSVWLRYLILMKESIAFPANAYKGDYVVTISEELFKVHQNRFFHPWQKVQDSLPPDEPDGGDKERYIDALISRAKLLLGQEDFHLIHQLALNSVLNDIKDDLAEFGVHYDSWFSEQTLLEDDSLQKGIEALNKAGQTYKKEGALWFRATAFGDQKDWVLIRANGQATYFASDIAYHWNKYSRNFERLVDIFGADHHGYATRIKSAMKALGHNEKDLNILLVQFAILYRQGERVQMSTRSGSFVTLRELREEVGNDAARFFYVMRKPEQHMDFDLDLAKLESNDNPVYYIQYAHARISSVLQQLNEKNLSWDKNVGLSYLTVLTESEETTLINLISRYPEVLQSAAKTCEPHQVAFYLRELAMGLHSYYNAIRLICEDVVLRNARLSLLVAVRQVLRNGLQLLGVSAPESM